METLPILRPENVQLIAQSAPQIYNDNRQRATRCADFGQTLIAEIQQHGMTDDLDQRCASFIEKARKTVKLMNEQRAPITKLFDQIRTEFTTMESSADPTKSGSIPYQIQAHRNQYAAQKHEEENRRRQEELLKAQRQQALTKYEQDVEDNLRQQFNAYINNCINELSTLNSQLTTANFEEQSAKIKAYPATIAADLFNRFSHTALVPQILTTDEVTQIRSRVQSRLLNAFSEQYEWEVGDYKAHITDALPAKLTELQRIAKANAEEQERMRQELAAKEAENAARLEAERKQKEEEAKAQQQMQAQAQAATDLFNATSVATPDYQPKTSVKKRVEALNAEGIINIFSFWWSKEGQYLDVDELTKMFKKQITAVEKYANDKTSPELISSPHVRYTEEVKAK